MPNPNPNLSVVEILIAAQNKERDAHIYADGDGRYRYLAVTAAGAETYGKRHVDESTFIGKLGTDYAGRVSPEAAATVLDSLVLSKEWTTGHGR